MLPVCRTLCLKSILRSSTFLIVTFFQDGAITVDEFKQAVKNTCVGKKYEDFPQAMKAFIETNFRMIDINADGLIGVEEFRYDCIQRMVVEDIKVIDDAYNSLLNVSEYFL